MSPSRFIRAENDPQNPLVRADRPWEGWRISIYGTVLYDQDEQRFKMWYTTDESDDFPNYAVAYATSRDGIAWEKPLVGTAAAKKTFRAQRGSGRDAPAERDQRLPRA